MGSLQVHSFCEVFSFFYFFFYSFFLRYFPEKHTGKNISVSLDNMIEALGLAIENIELFSVNDNASNMKLAIRMSSYLTEYNCDIHTLELVLKDGIQASPAVEAVLKKTKKIA